MTKWVPYVVAYLHCDRMLGFRWEYRSWQTSHTRSITACSASFAKMSHLGWRLPLSLKTPFLPTSNNLGEDAFAEKIMSGMNMTVSVDPPPGVRRFVRMFPTGSRCTTDDVSNVL